MDPKERVLITGASSGIGLELARCFARGGYDLVLVARREAQLESLAKELREQHKVDVKIVAKDLSSAAACDELHSSLTGSSVDIDVVVNNAGFGLTGDFSALPMDRQLEMIRLNVLTLTHLSHLFLGGMLKRRRGGILNVASTAAFQSGPGMSVYYATKAFVLSFSEGLMEEVAEHGVTVSCLCPGPTATEFGAVSGMDTSALFKMGTMDVRDVAQAGFDGFRARTAIVVPGATNCLGAFLVRFFPRVLVRKVIHKLQRGKVAAH